MTACVPSSPCGPGTMQVDGVCTATGGLRCGAGTMQVQDECRPASELRCGPGTMAQAGECLVTPIDGGVVCGAGTMLVGGACVPANVVRCGPGTQLVSGECLALPTDGGVVPSNPVRCGAGTRLVGTECVVAPIDGGVVCGPGTALVDGVCLPARPDGGSGVWAQPGTVSFSPSGTHVGYLELGPGDGGPTRFTRLGWRVAPVGQPAFSVGAFTSNEDRLIFARGAPFAVLSRFVSFRRSSTLIDLRDGGLSPLPNAGENEVALAADLSAVVTQNAGTSTWRPIPSGAPVTLLTNMPQVYALATGTVAGKRVFVFSTSTALTILDVDAPNSPLVTVPVNTNSAPFQASTTLAGDVVYWGDTSSNLAVRLDGGVTTLPPGSFGVAPSPDGRHFVTLSGTVQLVELANPGNATPVGVLQGPVATWADDSTVYVLGSNGDLRRVTTSGQASTVDVNVESFSIVQGGVVTQRRRTSTSALTISIDGTMFPIPVLASAQVVRGGTTTPLEPSTFVLGAGPLSPVVARTFWVWDFFSGQTPDPRNGVSFITP